MPNLSEPPLSPPKPLRLNRDSLEAKLCRQSFFDFFLRFWPAVVSEKLVLNWHIELLCNELQVVMERVFARQPKLYDLIINVSPGSTKSTIASEMLPAWCWTRDTSLRSICGSYGHALALDIANKCRRIVTCDKYRRLFPEVELVQEAKSIMETREGGQRIATSVGGSITGMHGHVLIIDDPLNPKEAVSDAHLKAANEWFDNTLMSRVVDKAISPMILIMQRLHEADPTAHLLGRQSTPIRHICLPAELSERVRPRSLRRNYVNGMFDPVRLSRDVLKRARADGEYAYAGQYEQHPVPAGGGMFRVDQLRIESHAPPLKRIVRYWDKAGSALTGCFTVGLKMGVAPDGVFWILDIVRGQWEAWTRERIIRQTAEADGKIIQIGVEVEPGSGGKESGQGTVRNLAGFRVKLDRPTGDKVERADPFAAQLNGGNVRLIRAEWNRPYIHELQFFPLGKYKDQVDASSGAFNMLVGRGPILGAF